LGVIFGDGLDRIGRVGIAATFFKIDNLVSPLTCERLCDSLANFKTPDLSTINNNLQTVLHTIEQHYQTSITQLLTTTIEHFNPYISHSLTVDNSVFVDSQWKRVNNSSISVIIFLTDNNEIPPFDPTHEVYGGTISFPTWSKTFFPVAGTALIYPSTSNFLHVVNFVEIGDYYHIKCLFETLKLDK